MLKRIVMISTFLVLVGSLVATGPAYGDVWLWPCDFSDLAGAKVTVTFCASPPAPASPEAGNTYWDVIEDMGGRRGRADIITPSVPGPEGGVVLQGTGDTWDSPWNIYNNTDAGWIEQVVINLATVPCTSRVAFDKWPVPPQPMGSLLSARGLPYTWMNGPTPIANYVTLAPGPPVNAGDMYLELWLDYACDDLDPAWFPPDTVHVFMADTDDWQMSRSPTETRPDCGNSECWGYLPTGVTGFDATVGFQGVTVQWSCALQGFDYAGFNVYRSAGESGHYELLNGGLITGESPFSYVDTDVEPGQTYYYQLGVVDLSGSEELYGPVSIAIDEEVSWGVFKVKYR